MKVRSQQYESLDALCFRYYGTTQGTVEQVLGANPGLCDQSARLPMGLEIELPDIAPPRQRNGLLIYGIRNTLKRGSHAYV